MASFGSLLILALLSLLIFYWQNSLRAKAWVMIAVKQACDARDVQLLDDTVTLAKVSFLSLFTDRAIYRAYTFDYVDTLGERQTASVVLMGKTITQPVFETKVAIQKNSEGDNVIAFPTDRIRKAKNEKNKS